MAESRTACLNLWKMLMQDSKRNKQALTAEPYKTYALAHKISTGWVLKAG